MKNRGAFHRVGASEKMNLAVYRTCGYQPKGSHNVRGGAGAMEKFCKMLSRKRWFASALALVILLLPLFGCEDKLKEDDQKVVLMTLAEQYMIKRMIERDYESTYDMELAKNSMPFSEYLKNVHNVGQIKFLSIKAKDVKIEDDKAVVRLTVTCRVANVPKDLELTLKDVWILKSDGWLFKSKEWKHKLQKRAPGIIMGQQR
jgi:hypothetical protein